MPHTYFLAHASADVALARQLYARLAAAGVRCFLDAEDLLPGDEWDLVIPRAQRAAAATIVLVPPAYDAAYYLRVEVHAAIALGRQPGSEHRLVPVFVDGPPNPMPYGIGLKQGLDLAKLGMDEVVSQLVALAGKLGGGGTPPSAPPPAAPARDLRQLHDALCAIQRVGGMFQEILRYDLPEAENYISAEVATPAQRAGDLVQWASLQGGDTLERLWQAAKKKAPGLL